jgi:hypothetical protein
MAVDLFGTYLLISENSLNLLLLTDFKSIKTFDINNLHLLASTNASREKGLLLQQCT